MNSHHQGIRYVFIAGKGPYYRIINAQGSEYQIKTDNE